MTTKKTDLSALSDEELSNGRVSLEVEKRIAEFGVNDVFEEAAARFTMQ